VIEPSGNERTGLDHRSNTVVFRTVLTKSGGLPFETGRNVIAQNARHGHGFERGPDNMGRARPIGLVVRLRLQQFCVRQDDPELIVQPVKQGTKIADAGGILAIFDHCHARPPTSGPMSAGRPAAATASR